jgi:hypothetical protein
MREQLCANYSRYQRRRLQTVWRRGWDSHHHAKPCVSNTRTLVVCCKVKRFRFSQITLTTTPVVRQSASKVEADFRHTRHTALRCHLSHRGTDGSIHCNASTVRFGPRWCAFPMHSSVADHVPLRVELVQVHHAHRVLFGHRSGRVVAVVTHQTFGHHLTNSNRSVTLSFTAAKAASSSLSIGSSHQ